MTTGPESRGAAIVRGDALSIPLGDSTVDLIVTSPPYFGQRSYQDAGGHCPGQIGAEPHPQEFLAALWAVMAECWRVLKPSGSAFVNLGDKRAGSGAPGTTTGLSGRPKYNATNGVVQGQRSRIEGGYTKAHFGRKKSRQMLPQRFAIGCEDGLADPDGIGWIMREELIWWKKNGLPEPVTDRCQDKHEWWYHLTKRGDYYADVDEIRQPYAGDEDHGSPLPYADDSAGTRHGRDNSTLCLAGAHPLGAVPPTVWQIATESLTAPEWLDVNHFAAFPTEWPRRLISGWCPPDGTVLDPFGGTGTTAMVARALGRFGVSLDLSADYLRLANWRIWQSGQAAKVAARSDRDRQGVLL